MCSFNFTIVPLQGTLRAKLPKFKIQMISFWKFGHLDLGFFSIRWIL